MRLIGNPVRNRDRPATVIPKNHLLQATVGLADGKAQMKQDKSGDLPDAIYFNNLVDWILK